MNSSRSWFVRVRHRVWTRALTVSTASVAVMALTVPLAAAEGVTGYQFKGTVWNPKTLPATPGVAGRALTGSGVGVVPAPAKGAKALGHYTARAAQWPAAGTSTVALTRPLTDAPHATTSAVPSGRASASAAPRAASPTAQAASPTAPAAALSLSGRSVPVSGPVRAGALPVWVAPAPTVVANAHQTAKSATPAPSPPAAVRVQVASHDQALAAGANGMLIGFTPAAGSPGNGRVQIVVDYSALAKAYGGGYGSRLALFQLPACALTTPWVKGCTKRTPLTFTNRGTAEQLTATIGLAARIPTTGSVATRSSARTALAPMDTTSSMTMVGISSGDAGSQGNYAATSLNPSSSWQASATGSFTYSYPIAIPPALGGSVPSVGFSYDSQSVDGETSARNAQSSWIGDGWDYQPGFIERSYRSCSSLLKSDGTHVLKGSGDECWGGDNATLSFGSHSGTLVPTTADTTVPNLVAQWKLQGEDDGTIVQELSGAQNGLYNGIFYRVLSTDGSIAYFGADHAPATTAENSAQQSGTPADASTNSAWGVPVLHPVSGDPCYNSSDDTASKCSSPEGWRWNLDFTVTPGGFVQRYDYSAESNYYDLGGGQVAASNGSGKLTSYTRGGTLTKISYGYQLADELAGRMPAAEVDFVSKQRCQTSSSFDCTAELTDSNATNWPDVPFDLACESGDTTTIPQGATSVPAGTCITDAPTFWSTMRLDQVVTKVHVVDQNPTTDHGMEPVDTYQLGQVYSDAGGTVDPVTGTGVDPKDAGQLQAVMWLQSITHTGDADSYDGGSTPITMNQLSFTGTEIDNRVNDASPAGPPLYRPRISSIQTETGGQVSVNYNTTPCAGLSLSFSSADANANSCYPVYWSPSGGGKPLQDWFNKITVQSVVDKDLTIPGTYSPKQSQIAAGSPEQVSVYSYSQPAWHRDDSALTDDQYRTWDQFRGFRTVTVQTGAFPDPITQSTTTYLQGMDGDYKADGTQRSIKVPDSVGDNVTDSNWLSGTALETDTYTGAGGTITAKTVNPIADVAQTDSVAQTPWTDWNTTDNPGQTQPTLSTLPPLISYRSKDTTTRTYSLLADGSTWRENQTVATFDSLGRPSTADAIADVTAATTSAQERCATTSYASPVSTAPQMLAYPDQSTVTAGPCATPTQLLSDKQVYYTGDGTLTNLGTFGQLSASGLPTGTRVASSCNAGAAMCSGTSENWQTTTAIKYDGAGRGTDSYDANGNHTHTDFTPAWNAAGGNTNPTTIVSTNPKGWTTTSKLDPLRGLTIENSDANSRLTDITYDALGRRTAVWLPGRSQATQSADETFSYSINPGAVPAPGGTITTPGAPTSVTTKTLREDGTYATSVDIYDGLLQPRQTQSTAQGDTATGRLISDTFYDSHGWPRLSYATYSEPSSAPSSTIWAADEATVPAESATVYDGEGRAITQQLFRMGVEQWQTSTSYPGADETDTSQIQDPTGKTIPGGGGTSTSTYTDALGQTTSSVVHNTASGVTLQPGQVVPSGTSLTSASVRLSMEPGGNLALYGVATGTKLWSTSTSGTGNYAQFGTDGNLHVYSATGTSLWTSPTSAGTGGTLQVQNDGNLVTYTSAGTSAWASGTGGQKPADSTTSYTYTPVGQVNSIKDSAGNTWQYQYNLLGQKTSQTDPDSTGSTTYGPYDALGNLEQVTDPRGQVISYQYDWDNRITGEYTGAWSATPDSTKQLTGYVYDTLAKGYPTSSTRYVGGSTGANSKAYAEAVTGYNTAYQPTGATLTIPASDGFAPAGASVAPSSGTVTYNLATTYSTNIGLLATTSYQADGGLPAEQISYGYNQQGDLNGFGGFLTSTNTPAYLDNVQHDPFGREQQANYGPSGQELATFAQYDQTSGRVLQTSSMLQASKTSLDVVDYRYNQAGDLTAVDDIQNNTTHDTQCFTYDSFNRLTQAWSDTGYLSDANQTTGVDTNMPVGGIGGCTNSSGPVTTTTAPITTKSVGGPAPYWQTYSYDLLGDRTSMVNHDTSGNAANDTTQTTALAGTDGTTAATLPNQATTSSWSNPAVGSVTQTDSYTDNSINAGANAGKTMSRTLSAGPLTPGIKSTTSGYTGKNQCLTDTAGWTTAGTKQATWPCSTGNTSQQYTLGTDGTLKVNGMCLDTTSGAKTAGTGIVINTCNAATTTQKWKAGSYNTLVNTGANLCLTIPGAAGANSTQATIAACPSNAANAVAGGQSWTTAGGQTPGTSQTFTYDPEGRTSSVTTTQGGTTQQSKYLYDANGTLLEQTSNSGTADTQRILYLFGGAEQITQNVPNKSWTALRNYTGPDGTTITRTSGGTVTYQIANAQGTAETAINYGLTTTTRRYYDPYGNPRGTQPSTWISTDENHGFLGKPTDSGAGLDLLGARTYDPTTGRFTSPDPIFEAGDPNQMGGYTYAADNPSTGSDPSGLIALPFGDGARHDLNHGWEGHPELYQSTTITPTQVWHALVNPSAAVVDSLQSLLEAVNPVMKVVDGYTITPLRNKIEKAVGVNKDSLEYFAGGAASALLDVGPEAGLEAAVADGAATPKDLAVVEGDAAGATGAGAKASDAAGAHPAGGSDSVGDTQAANHAASDPSDPGTGSNSSGDNAPETDPKCSFAPDTPVLMADGKTEPIGKLKVGDQVESANPNTGKETGGRTVQHIWINHDTDLLDVTVSDGHGHASVLHTTANHPFWDDTTHTWVRADHLKSGDKLASTKGHDPTVINTKVAPGAANRWNLTVQQLHTYYVVAGGVPILVHNTNVACETPPGRQVAYGSTDLSQEALVARALDGNRSNLYAVARWTDSQGGIQTLAVHASSEGHAEQLMIPRLAERGAAPSDVTDLYVEYQPCSGTVNCEGKILPQFTNPEFELTYSFPWNSDPAVQNAARRGLAAAVRDLWPPRT